MNPAVTRGKAGNAAFTMRAAGGVGGGVARAGALSGGAGRRLAGVLQRITGGRQVRPGSAGRARLNGEAVLRHVGITAEDVDGRLVGELVERPGGTARVGRAGA